MAISTGKKARRQVPKPNARVARRNHFEGNETSGRKNRVAAPYKDGDEQLYEFKPIVTKNFAQDDYLDKLRHYDIVFGLGPAGTGKTYLATAFAAEQIFFKDVEKIIITRPAVEAAGENLGFLPGELEDKFRPYLIPFLETFYEKLGKGYTELLIKSGVIEAIPMGFLRGRSFKNAIVLLDEAENTSPEQMKLLLTRLGENCRVLINGDIAQKDIDQFSGLEDGIKVLQHLPECAVVEFMTKDIVRSNLCRKIVQAYDGR